MNTVVRPKKARFCTHTHMLCMRSNDIRPYSTKPFVRRMWMWFVVEVLLLHGYIQLFYRIFAHHFWHRHQPHVVGYMNACMISLCKRTIFSSVYFTRASSIIYIKCLMFARLRITDTHTHTCWHVWHARIHTHSEWAVLFMCKVQMYFY